MNEPPLSIAVLCGGPSAERTISLSSGAAVARELRVRGHRVMCLDPCGDLTPETELGTPELLGSAARFVRRTNWTGFDVVCNALHGTFGEDGGVQAELHQVGVAYTGSGAAASRAGFRKAIAKRRFQLAGLETPRGVVLSGGDPLDRLELAAERLGYPVIIKPEAQGSSLGVSIVESARQLEAAAAHAFAFGDDALMEAFISGEEWTVPVWDDAALPVIQIVPRRGLFDYVAKYSDELTEYRLDPEVPREIREQIAEAGLTAARAVGATGLSRVDLRRHPDGRLFVLEINTSPGMTDHSLVPKSAAHFGLTLGELCERDCRRAMARQAARGRQVSAA